MSSGWGDSSSDNEVEVVGGNANGSAEKSSVQ